MIHQTVILSIRRVAGPDYPLSVPSLDSLDSTLEPDKPNEELPEDELSSDLASLGWDLLRFLGAEPLATILL